MDLGSVRLDLEPEGDGKLLAHSLWLMPDERFCEIEPMWNAAVVTVVLLASSPGLAAAVNQPVTPIGPIESWELPIDYPSRAIRNNVSGAAGYRLTVGPDGTISDCQITSSSGSAELDLATCSSLRRRARFTPATDRKGRPIIGVFEGIRKWVVPPTRIEDDSMWWVVLNNTIPLTPPDK